MSYEEHSFVIFRSQFVEQLVVVVELEQLVFIWCSALKQELN